MVLSEQLFFHIKNDLKDILFHLLLHVLCLDVELWEDLSHFRIFFIHNFGLVFPGLAFLDHLVVVFLAKKQVSKLFSLLQVLV